MVYVRALARFSRCSVITTMPTVSTWRGSIVGRRLLTSNKTWSNKMACPLNLYFPNSQLNSTTLTYEIIWRSKRCSAGLVPYVHQVFHQVNIRLHIVLVGLERMIRLVKWVTRRLYMTKNSTFEYSIGKYVRASTIGYSGNLLWME